MGRPDQGNKAQTPVGYSHGTGVSTGGLATAVLGVTCTIGAQHRTLKERPILSGYRWQF